MGLGFFFFLKYKKTKLDSERKNIQCMNVKTSLKLAYKIVNYTFDSEISQTAAAKEYKCTQGLERSGMKHTQTHTNSAKGGFKPNLACRVDTHTTGHLPSLKLTDQLFSTFYVQEALDC